MCEGKTIAWHWLTSTIDWTHQTTVGEGGEERRREERGEEGGEEREGRRKEGEKEGEER